MMMKDMIEPISRTGKILLKDPQARLGAFNLPPRAAEQIRSDVLSIEREIQEQYIDEIELARAAHLFMNIGRCPNCHRAWPIGLIHVDCPKASDDDW